MPEPFPHLTVRTILRRLASGDLAEFQAYRHDPVVGRYQGWIPVADVEAAKFLERMRDAPFGVPGEWLQIGIADRATGALLGDIGLCVDAAGDTAEIGFTLAPGAQGRGLGTEAVGAAVGLLFERTGVHRVVGVTDTRNTPSMRLLERIGMRRVATAPAVFRGEACIEHTYAISRGAPSSAPPATAPA